MVETKKILTGVGVTLAVYIVIKYLLPYVIPFLIAYVLVHVLNPIVEKIQTKLRWKKEIIVSVLLVILLAVFTFLFYLLYCQLMVQIRRIAMNFDYYYSCFCGIVDDCCMMAEKSFGIRVDSVKEFVYSSINHATEQIKVYIIPGVFNYSVRYLKKLADLGLFLLMLFVSVILLMKDYDDMNQKFRRYSFYGHFHNISQRIWKQGGMYMKAQMIIILIISILCTAGLWALGNVLIPMAVFLMFRQNFRLAAGYIGLFLLTYIVREFLEPRLIGAKLGVYPFVMVVVVYVGLYLFGTPGVFFGPVMLLIVMEILREIYKRPECDGDSKKKMLNETKQVN